MGKHKLWTSRIEKTKGYQYQQHTRWKKAIDLYNCRLFDDVYGGFDTERVDVHFGNWYVNNLVPLVYFRDPFIFTKPRHLNYDGFAKTLETLINYHWIELGLKEQFKKAIKSGFLTPPGWLKIGYTAKIGQDVAEPEKNIEKNLLKEVKDAILGKTIQKLPEEQGVLNEYIKEESIFVSWIPSWNILVPEGYNQVSQMPWLVEIEDMSMLDFKANPKYSNKGEMKSSREIEEKTSKTTTLPSYDKTLPAGGKDEESQIIRLYHIWDRRNQEQITISDYGVHFDGDYPYDIEGFPFEPLMFEDSIPTMEESNFYPPTVFEPILPQIIEQSNARTQMVKHRKRASAIILAQKGLVDEADLNQLENTEQIQLIQVSNLSAFQMTQTPALPQEVFKIDDIIKQDLQQGTSMGQMMFQAQPGQRTATQATIAQSGLQLKASARVDVVEDITTRVARKMAQLMWQFYDAEKVSEIIGEPVTPEMWLALPDNKIERRKMIQSELQFKIDAGSAAPPKDESVDRKQLIDVVSVVAGIAPEYIKKAPFISKFLEKFKFAKDLESVVKGHEEEEMAAAQKESEYLSQNMPQVVSPNEIHEVHIKVHSQFPPNPVSDQHIAEHGQYMQTGTTPQQGDTRAPSKSTAPEINRQGNANQGDIYQSTQNLGIGTGAS